MRSAEEVKSRTRSFLASIPLFEDIGEMSLASLARECAFRQVKKGEVLFLQGDASEKAFIVQSGKISLTLNSLDGREMVINEMQMGDIFGELGILTRKSHSASAVARTPGEVLEIPRRALLRIIQSEHLVAIRLLEIVANRLQISSERESALAFLDAQARLARLLLDLENQEQEKGYVTISQDELAQRTGLIRQTVAKALGKWRRAGWLITGRGRILILNRKALEELETSLQI